MRVKRKKGYSIAEIIIVLAVMAIMVSGVLPIFLNVMVANISSKNFSNAYKIADSKIEEYRNTPFLNIESEEFDIPELADADGHGSLTVTEEVDGVAAEGIKKLDLTISWNYKRERNIRIVTYITEGGISR